jgi:2-C-methyl-D-erythritol 4-phosphate cytidylyltransferase
MTVALILAAGRGERLGASVPKARVEVAGRSLVSWSVEALRGVPRVEAIVIALPPEDESAPDGWTTAAPSPPEVIPVAGGATRSESVRRALAAAPDGDPVLVHDAARPLVTSRLAEAVIAALERDESADAAIAAAPVTDTVKRAGRDGIVRETLDRGELWAVQTPQVFRRAALERALDVAPEVLAAATDDASLIERAGGRVLVVAASSENLKVTTPVDLEIAAMLLERRARQSR